MRSLLPVLGCGLALAALPGVSAPPLSGAIFTTTVDGTVVNENVHYEYKEDVYLDGGPGPNAPVHAAGLPEGDYYFQVTDPSGQDLLSSDHISCRRIHVNAAGVIDTVYAGTNYAKQQGKWAAVACQHRQGTDSDHAADGAVTVQLYPYDDTPNMGGVYKAWITPVGNYTGSLAGCPIGQNGPCNVNGENYQAGNHHGFLGAASKTDNYKVKKKGKPYVSPVVSVRKFHDSNMNATWDAGEEEISGWAVDVTDPTAVTNTVYTAATVVAEPAGVWTFVEATPAGTLQTAAFRDGAAMGATPAVPVTVAGTSGETHTVVYGNVALGSASACKIYDRNGNGVADEGEPGVAGYRITLGGVTVTGAVVSGTRTTGADGCTTFANLAPGSYTISELMPGGTWQATGATSYTFSVASTIGTNGGMQAPAHAFSFTNNCTGSADFGTKGYWHNKNGLAEITDGDVAYVNGLPPYASASSYFGAGDEPFNGMFSDGSPVAGVNGEWGELLAPAGSTLAEISQFLVDSNAGGDAREQLAQQLLAFIFNSRHRLDDPQALVQLPGGGWASAASLIAEALAAWQSGDAAWQNAIKTTLDTLNNGDALPFVHWHATSCAVTY